MKPSFEMVFSGVQMRRYEPSPRARGAAAAAAIVGTLISNDLHLLLLAWLGILLPLTIAGGIARQHMKFVTVFLGPVTAALLLVWGWMVAAPPGMPVGSSPEEGLSFGCMVALRLTVLGGVIQLCFLTISPEQLIATVRCWGLRGEGLVIVAGTLALGPELRLRSDQVLTARYARGLVPNRSFSNRLRQLPFLLRPLLAWVLRSAIQRSEIWHQRGLLARLQTLPVEPCAGSSTGSAFFVFLAFSWLVYNIATRVSG